VFGDLGTLPRGWLLDDLFRDWQPSTRRQGCVPAIDVAEDEKHYAITVEIPGVKKEDVQVEIHEGMLTIRGEKKSEREEKDERRRYVERSYGSFSRSFSLPTDADGDRVEASFKDGILTITIPKTAESKPQTVAIKGG
jgi:HSP20 family protein